NIMPLISAHAGRSRWCVRQRDAGCGLGTAAERDPPGGRGPYDLAYRVGRRAPHSVAATHTGGDGFTAQLDVAEDFVARDPGVAPSLGRPDTTWQRGQRAVTAGRERGRVELCSGGNGGRTEARAASVPDGARPHAH